MADGKYFSTTKKGEIHELKEELRSLEHIKKKDAVKKVIAAMTVGKDVSMLFPDVVNCMQTADLELKKLVYLYLINYAKAQPDLAIMAVNTFVNDAKDNNPLIRALALRTMGCIRVEKISEYLCGPLSMGLKDTDPYVRKTAAVCVAKLFDISQFQVETHGFVGTLRVSSQGAAGAWYAIRTIAWQLALPWDSIKTRDARGMPASSRSQLGSCGGQHEVHSRTQKAN
ncbi:B2-adapt-app_C domain-containing protein, partial [Haematococcus lacustris]